MVTYRFREDRCSFFERRDGSEIALLPSHHCKLCALPIPPKYERYGRCNNCHAKDTRIDGKNLLRVYAASLYIVGTDYLLNKEIVNCKDDLSYVGGLSEILEHAITKMYPILLNHDYLVPAPRGTATAKNHIKFIAEKISEKLGIRTRDILFKKIDYPPQLRLKKEARIVNVVGNIGCVEQVSGRIIVVDDMYTTGATMLGSAMALREKGAAEVVGLVIARSVSTSDLLRAEIFEKVEENAD